MLNKAYKFCITQSIIWCIGFSNGTKESAKTDQTEGGGGCTANPPVKLTVSIEDIIGI